MIVGHYATALIAHNALPKYFIHQQLPKKALLFFLIASQFQDILWFVFHYLGLESTSPSDVFSATLSDMAVVMVYSHHLIPQLIWALVAFLAGKLLFNSNRIGLIAMLLSLGHFVLDLLSGHPHYLFGESSHQIGLGLYANHVYAAILIEAVFVTAVLAYLFKAESAQGIVRARNNKMALIGLFVYGIVFLLLIATVSFRDRFGIPDFDLRINTAIPTIILTYVGMLVFLLKVVSATDNT
ncbi:MAG: hypothetical protein AAGF06_07185 [Pseudomonadota bacterium]